VTHRWLVVAGYLAILLTLTFMPLAGSDRTQSVDLRLIPFRTISFAFRSGLLSREFVVLIGNVVAFIPVGVLVPVISGRRSLLLVLLASFALSAAIEVGQLVVSLVVGYAYRSADVDDVIVNVFGGIVGYVGFALLTTIRTRAAAPPRRRPANR
jgi:glycopeptide antibiotics resistance protein